MTHTVSRVVGNWFERPLHNPDTDKAPGAGEMAADEARKAELRASINKMYGIGDDTTAAQMTADRDKLSGDTRAYYTDQLARSFGAAERNNRFSLARQGLMGGSADIDSNAQLQTDQNLGATRVDEAARRAAAGLDTQREQERLSAVGLVNSGAGEDAVASAQAGLRNTLETAATGTKANLFNDLFTTGADAYGQQAQNAALMAQLGRYQQQLSYFYPTTSSSGGRITPSGG